MFWVILFLWFFIGFASAVYVALVDGTEGALTYETPSVLLLCCFWAGIFGLLSFAYAVYVAWDVACDVSRRNKHD